MKISFVSALTLDSDLHKTRELEIMKALVRRGHTVTLIAITSKQHIKMPDDRIKLIAIPIRFKPLISTLVWAFTLTYLLPLHLLSSRPDFVIMDPEISVLGSLPTRLLPRLFKTKFVLDIRSTPVEVVDPRGRLLALTFNASVLVAKKFFDGMAFVTTSMKNEVCRQYGIDKSEVCVWTNGVPLDLFEPQSYSNQSLRLRKNLNLEQKFVIFYHGVYSPTRGLTQTIEAIRIVLRQNPQIALLLLGSGPIISELNRLVHEGQLENNVVFHNPVAFEKVPEFICLSDVCIVPLPDHPYWRYQNALNLLEYMAMEKVVLATDIYANRIVAGEANCCIYLPSVDPVDIANSIRYAYENREKLGDWGKVGREIIREKYTWDKVAEDVELYLASLN